MPSVRKKTNKTGQVFYEIRVSRGRGQSYLTNRWYPPEGWSQRAIDRELARQAAEFERRVKAGEVVSRVERAAQEAEAARLAAQIKTVRQYADEIFLPAKSLTLAENTRSLYEMFLRRHILPAIGDFRMQEVTPAMLTKTIFNFQKIGAAHSSVLTLHVVLHGLFEMAALDGTIELSPMGKVKRPARPKDERADEAEKALTAERLAYVLDCAANEPLKWQTYIGLAADTGARRGELCGLQWQDIDWKGGVIHIERNLQYSPREGVYLTLPKTGKGRVVDVGTETLALLHRLREDQASSCVSQWVFTQDGTADPMFPTSPTRYFRRFGEKYGIQGFHPHLLRHSSASISLTSGADQKSVAERLGHSDAVMLRRYVHATPESIRRAGQIVRDKLKEA
ncbi:MAG: site-specific integrase [Oscillospiraceae bacterium]|nr:site-specific integrase [Oscillospiraceae bacterium]